MQKYTIIFKKILWKKPDFFKDIITL
jgi:hypothetical protein